MELELETTSSVSEEQFDTALRFGVNLEQDSTDVKKYIVAFLQALVVQRLKIKLGVLDEYIQAAVKVQWKELLSILQDRGRQLVNVQSGSLFLTLFCPTTSSIEQLQNEVWRKKLTEGLKNLFTTTGMNILRKSNTKKRLSIKIQNKNSIILILHGIS